MSFKGIIDTITTAKKYFMAMAITTALALNLMVATGCPQKERAEVKITPETPAVEATSGSKGTGVPETDPQKTKLPINPEEYKAMPMPNPQEQQKTNDVTEPGKTTPKP